MGKLYYRPRPTGRSSSSSASTMSFGFGGAGPSTASSQTSRGRESSGSDPNQTTLPLGRPGREPTNEEKTQAAESESKILMRQMQKKIDPDINDHGEGHVDRVAGNLKRLRQTLEESGLTEKELGRPPYRRRDNSPRCGCSVTRRWARHA